MKKYILLLALLGGCTSGFDELNTDPNRVDRVTPGSLLTPVVYGMSTYFTVRNTDFTWELMQVGLSNPSVANDIHRYDIQETTGNGTWNTCYRWLRNVREMEQAADVYGQPIYKAVANTLRAYIVGLLTDSFGDVPYSEAMRAEEGISQPRFDTQEEIYKDLIARLEEANTLYTTAHGSMNGNDLLFANDKAKWRKFNNSLLLRLLLRVSKRPEMNSYERLKTMLADPVKYPVFTGNADAALVKISGIPPYDYAWGRRQDYVNFVAFASFFVEALNDLNDPRRPLFMTRATQLVSNKPVDLGYRGIPAAHSGDASQFNYTPSTPNGDLMIYTTLGTEILEVIMSYAEVEFIRAEVALYFRDQAAARTAYEKGVTAAITQWKNGAVPADYFKNPKAAFDGTLEQLMTQKYLALFMNDFQQWFEYRRTGLPVLPKTPYMLHEGRMPTRLMYHTDARRFNPWQYKAAAERMGGDLIHAKVWWEK